MARPRDPLADSNRVGRQAARGPEQGLVTERGSGYRSPCAVSTVWVAGAGGHRYTLMPGPCWNSPRATPVRPWVPGSLSLGLGEELGIVGAFSRGLQLLWPHLLAVGPQHLHRRIQLLLPRVAMEPLKRICSEPRCAGKAEDAPDFEGAVGKKGIITAVIAGCRLLG